jgi:hypothetical protein
VSFTQGGRFELSEAEQAREEQAGQAESEEKSNEIGACFGHQPPSGSAFSGQQRRWPDPTLPT